MNSFPIRNFEVGGDRLTIIAGPCLAESMDLCQEVAGAVKALCQEFEFNYIFKASFDKANRTSVNSVRGAGMAEGLRGHGRGPAYPSDRGRHTRLARYHRRSLAGSVRGSRYHRGYPADSSLPLPPERPAGSRRRDPSPGQREEGAIPGPPRHQEHRGQGAAIRCQRRDAYRARHHLWLQRSDRGHGGPGDHAQLRCARVL